MQKKTSWSWLIVSTLSIFSVAVLGTGFFLALFPQGQETASVQEGTVPAAPATASTQAQKIDTKTYKVLALGDSLTKGVGDTDGKGYVGYLKDSLQTDSRKVVAQNLGISGLESSQLVKSVQSPGIQAMIQDAGLIVISIGGNDVTHSLGGVEQVLRQGVDEAKVRAAKEEYTKNLAEILTAVRAHNKQTPVLVLGLYNPFEGMFPQDDPSERLLLEWNDSLRTTAQSFPQVKVVPMFDIFQWNNDKLLSMDHFHPNADGYKRMAQRIVQTLPQDVAVKGK